MNDYKIETSRFTSQDRDKPKDLEPLRRYPFGSLEPGQCFYMEAPDSDESKKAIKRARSAMWQFNKRTQSHLCTRTMEDGRVAFFNPIDEVAAKLEQEERHPTQLEFVTWLSRLESNTSQTINATKCDQPFSTLVYWIDDYKKKSGASIDWTITGNILEIEVK